MEFSDIHKVCPYSDEWHLRIDRSNIIWWADIHKVCPYSCDRPFGVWHFGCVARKDADIL